MRPSRFFAASILALTSALAMGCADRACEAEPPSLQVSVSLGADIATAEIARVVAEVSAAGQQKSAELDPQPLKSKRRASFVVIVGAEGARGFDYTVSVELLDSSGAALATARLDAVGVGNGCNAASLLLSRDGAPIDGGADAGTDTRRDGPTPNLVTYVLTGQTNLNLQTYLADQGAPTDREILVQVPSGVTIGSSDAGSPAITSGDLSAYQKVTLEIRGEVQGAGGTANSGAGGDALHLTSVVHIDVKSGGAIRGGGGGGGKGGTGGSCDNPNWSHVPYASKTYWKNYGSYNPPAGITLLLDSEVEQWRIAPMDRNLLFTNQAGAYWKRGGLVSGTNSGTSDAWFDHHRATALNSGNGGSGGNGGRGQGYAQSAAAGAAGGSGSAGRCGKGGTGGAGGNWASRGESGATGASGHKHTAYNLDTPQVGSAGSGGGAAGKALECAGAIRIDYANSGTISGAVNCSFL